MNFTNVSYNNWSDDYGGIYTSSSTTFTMPNHDVYIGMMRMGAMAEMHP